MHPYKHENSATQQIRRREPGSFPPGQFFAWAQWRWCRAGRKFAQAVDYAAALLSSTPWQAGCMELTWCSRVLASEVRSLDSVARKCAGFGASEGSCNPVKVTRPELPIEGGILRTQAGQLDLHICAVTRRGERDLNECRCRRRCVGSLTVPSNHQAVRGIGFDVAPAITVPSRSRWNASPGRGAVMKFRRP